MDGSVVKITIRHRTIRRQERATRINELALDMDIINARLQRPCTQQQREGYERLQVALYDAYCSVIDSEV